MIEQNGRLQSVLVALGMMSLIRHGEPFLAGPNVAILKRLRVKKCNRLIFFSRQASTNVVCLLPFPQDASFATRDPAAYTLAITLD